MYLVLMHCDQARIGEQLESFLTVQTRNNVVARREESSTLPMQKHSSCELRQ